MEILEKIRSKNKIIWDKRKMTFTIDNIYTGREGAQGEVRG